ncbi:hypothetical protein CQ12_16875 [Bradyrhizobium jicamae]|uniref:Response regulatory domain-containing protein n=1 Tax=Bradyrhizobium jicamae TaxID=280332 RepID=A0A0R3LMU3_9BRAD|nr:response regulator [Bradyrhizobium jicamae]KRR06496.1 hypothetical protein CQ12_16875 [Bradyrhizobium jicamae]
MPEIAGLDLYEHLVASGKAIPTILLTAHPAADHRVRALRAGVSYYFSKLFSDSKLLASIKSPLRSRMVHRRHS